MQDNKLKIWIENGLNNKVNVEVEDFFCVKLDHYIWRSINGKSEASSDSD